MDGCCESLLGRWSPTMEGGEDEDGMHSDEEHVTKQPDSKGLV